MEPYNTKGKVKETTQVTIRAPCLKQSSGMVSSDNTRQMMFKDHNRKVSWIELGISMGHVITQTNGVSMK